MHEDRLKYEMTYSYHGQEFSLEEFVERSNTVVDKGEARERAGYTGIRDARLLTDEERADLVTKHNLEVTQLHVDELTTDWAKDRILLNSSARETRIQTTGTDDI